MRRKYVDTCERGRIHDGNGYDRGPCSSCGGKGCDPESNYMDCEKHRMQKPCAECERTAYCDQLRTQLQAAGISVNELEKEVEYFKRKLHGQKENWLYTFAGQAMQGMLSHGYDGSVWTIHEIPEQAVKTARALLAELEKETT